MSSSVSPPADQGRAGRASQKRDPRPGNRHPRSLASSAHRIAGGTVRVRHRAAEQLVVRVAEEWIAGTGPRPAIARRCPDWPCDGGVVQDLPEDIDGVASDYRLPEGPVADVVLLRGNAPACVIEILVPHAVDPENAARMTLPWIELGPDDLLDHPCWWVALQDGPRPFACPRCAARHASLDEEIAALQGDWHLPRANDDYARVAELAGAIRR